ncbi:MAG: intradiol ring-cleavage dioxygenase [Bryobacteraceae bacterium]
MDLQQCLTQARLGRRELLTKLAGFGAAGAIGLPAALAQSETVSIVATPSATQGPYWVDEQLNRSDIRVDPVNSTVQQGFPLVLGITVSRLSGGVIVPVGGAFVDIWHCNAAGVYSDVSANATVGQKWLRGYQVTDAHGAVRFVTIYPGWYSGRAVHIHYRIRTASLNNPVFNYTSQFFFTETVTTNVFTSAPYSTRGAPDTRNTTDGIYNQSGGAVLLLRMAKDSSYCLSSFHVMLNGI